MLALGKLLELTLAGYEPAAKIQLTPEGARLRWLAEGALEILGIAGYLEFARKDGSAAGSLGLRRGDPVTLRSYNIQ